MISLVLGMIGCRGDATSGIVRTLKRETTMRRYAQFSIRSLLVLMLAVACWFGGWQTATWKAEREKREAIRQAKEETRKSRETPPPVNVQMQPLVTKPIGPLVIEPEPISPQDFDE